jgi:hypothetical protein
MSQEEKIFADGFSFKRQENAPDFVIGRVSIKVDDAIAFMQKHQKGGWVNLNAKYARSGNAYLELDTFEPKGKGEVPSAKSAPAPAPEEDGEVLPF